jgi:hypothetical protein
VGALDLDQGLYKLSAYNEEIKQR